jgi:hypothetical protein
MTAFAGDGTFRENLKSDPAVLEVIAKHEIDACFELDHVLAHVDTIVDRALAAP